MFFTYAVTMVPFMALAIALVFGLVIGRADATSSQRSLGATVVGAFMLLALVNFWWLYPILSAEAIPVQGWLRRMFLPSWI
jgi:dolichyl-phosphate-mannose--protein O-mannosyl transferase